MNYFERRSLRQLKLTIRPRRAWINIDKDAKHHLNLLEIDYNTPKDKTILEIGAGIGRLSKVLLDSGWNVIGIDSSKTMVNAAKSYLNNNNTILLCDGKGSIPYTEECSIVFSIICFQHIPNTDIVTKYIKEAHRLLERGGSLRFQLLESTERKGPLWTVHSRKTILDTLESLRFRVDTKEYNIWRFYNCTKA